MVLCKICGSSMKDNDDPIVLCKHQSGAVHMDCCTGSCSQHGSPCGHSQGTYNRE